MSVFDDEVLTIDDLARYLKLKRQTIYRWAQKKKLPGAKIGKEWRFRRSVIEAWIVKNLGETDGSESCSSNGSDSPGADASQRNDGPLKKRPPQRPRKGGPEKS